MGLAAASLVAHGNRQLAGAAEEKDGGAVVVGQVGRRKRLPHSDKIAGAKTGQEACPTKGTGGKTAGATRIK